MKLQIEIKDIPEMRWPEGWSRTLIKERVNRSNWKKNYAFYREQVVTELERFGANAVSIHKTKNENLDPGIAVWFSMKPPDDFSWQVGLQLDNPAPSLDEIDRAYRQLCQRHHPDAVANGSGGDVQMFHRLSEWRKKARAWVLGNNAPALDNCIPMDRFADARQNMAGVASALRHLRGLEVLGMPAILERVVEKTFKVALPANTGASHELTA